MKARINNCKAAMTSLAATFILATLAQSALAQARYSITDLGTRRMSRTCFRNPKNLGPFWVQIVPNTLQIQWYKAQNRAKRCNKLDNQNWFGTRRSAVVPSVLPEEGSPKSRARLL
jgi:hypothetical protein